MGQKKEEIFQDQIAFLVKKEKYTLNDFYEFLKCVRLFVCVRACACACLCDVCASVWIPVVVCVLVCVDACEYVCKVLHGYVAAHTAQNTANKQFHWIFLFLEHSSELMVCVCTY